MNSPLVYSINGHLEELALQALRDGENGAEWGVLERLVPVVLSGKQVDPVFQAVVNAIVAKAVFSGKLPSQRKGRPENIIDGVSGWRVAERYLELTDGGIKYADAVAQVAGEFHKAERHIMRLVNENKPGIMRRMGDTVEARQRFRAQRKLPNDFELPTEDAECVAGILAQMDALQAVLDAHLATEAQRDYLADLDRLIAKTLNQPNPTDIK